MWFRSGPAKSAFASRWAPSQEKLLRLVLLQQGMRPSLLGIAIGLGIAWGVMRLLAGSLFEIAPHDADTFIAASTLLVLVALAATYIPARRAMKVDPMAALRHE